MRIVALIFCLVLSFTVVHAQHNYAADLIPKEILPYARAVIRNSEETVEVKDIDNVIYHVKEAITVLNKNGDEDAHMVVEHDKSNIIKFIKGAIFDKYGLQTGKFNESDFDDVSAGNDFSLFEDARLKHFLPAINEYPYTIAYECEIRRKQTLNFDGWEPNPRYGVAVEKSSFVFSCKPDFKIRYKETNIPGRAVIGTNSAGEKTYSWKAEDLKAVKYEPFSPYFQIYSSNVKIAPEKFSYYGVNGSFTNWSELGKWIYDKLVANRQELPAETVEHIKEITKDIPDPKLKAKRIYEYMQGKTHYISVQVGVGSYQPFTAMDVDHQNYGDCKALVNYTQALLKAVNIDSYYCVVKSGSSFKVSMLDDFASMDQGDHVIICLPFKNDTTWADCTSQTIPFGYLGDFTDDRDVLACTPEGGKLMHTPKYTTNNNLESLKAKFTIKDDGELAGTMLTTFRGVDYENRTFLINETKDKQYKELQKLYPINNMDIENVDFKRRKSRDPEIIENITLNARDYAAVSGDRISFLLNSFNRADYPPPQVINRVNEVYINRGHTEEDEVTYTLPVGYALEGEPVNYTTSKPFGEYAISMTVTGNQLVCKRKFRIIDGTFSKDMYKDLVDFFEFAHDADLYSVSLVKK